MRVHQLDHGFRQLLTLGVCVLGAAAVLVGMSMGQSTQIGTIDVDSTEIQKEEGKREAKEWFEDGREGDNEEAAENERMFESEYWEDQSEPWHEEYYKETSEEIREHGGSDRENVNEGRIEHMRERLRVVATS
jgi:hypothetical protein